MGNMLDFAGSFCSPYRAKRRTIASQIAFKLLRNHGGFAEDATNLANVWLQVGYDLAFAIDRCCHEQKIHSTPSRADGSGSVSAE